MFGCCVLAGQSVSLCPKPCEYVFYFVPGIIFVRPSCRQFWCLGPTRPEGSEHRLRPPSLPALYDTMASILFARFALFLHYLVSTRYVTAAARSLHPWDFFCFLENDQIQIDVSGAPCGHHRGNTTQFLSRTLPAQ